MAAIEGRRNVEEASIPARLLLNCLALFAIVWFRTSLSARGPIVILRAYSFASLCIVAVTADRRLLKATWLVEPDELRCGYSRAAKRDRNWFVSHRTAFFFRFVRLYLISIASFSPHLASLSCLDLVSLPVFVSLFPSRFRRSWLAINT